MKNDSIRNRHLSTSFSDSHGRSLILRGEEIRLLSGDSLRRVLGGGEQSDLPDCPIRTSR